MALMATHKEVNFGVGDIIRVHQRLTEGQKSRIQIFEGQVIAIRGRDQGKSAVVRRVGAQSVGMELIFPLHGPTIEKVEVTRAGVKGVRHAKLYFTRTKPRRDIERIFSRTHGKDAVQEKKPKAKTSKSKKTAKAEK